MDAIMVRITKEDATVLSAALFIYRTDPAYYGLPRHRELAKSLERTFTLIRDEKETN